MIGTLIAILHFDFFLRRTIRFRLALGLGFRFRRRLRAGLFRLLISQSSTVEEETCEFLMNVHELRVRHALSGPEKRCESAISLRVSLLRFCDCCEVVDSHPTMFSPLVHVRALCLLLHQRLINLTPNCREALFQR